MVGLISFVVFQDRSAVRQLGDIVLGHALLAEPVSGHYSLDAAAKYLFCHNPCLLQ